MPGHLRVCRSCTAGVLRDLSDVPSLDRHLELALTRQTHMGDGAGGRTAETSTPWDERAREAEQVLRSTLTGWTRVLTDSVQPYRGPICRTSCGHRSCVYLSLGRIPADTLPAMAVWLMRHHAQLLGRASADEAVDEIRAAVRQARRAIDRPPGVWYAGPCGVEGCQADLYARHGARTVHCRTCAAIHDAAAREAWLMEQAADHLGTATEIARAVQGWHPGLTPSTIRGYAHRGRIVSRGADGLGRPLYRIGDVLDLLHERISS
ncbi:hypothetical protein ACQP1V_36325 [Microtetraspora malaysiensis]|uniref:hypothetical protein n=1 Tax=Microtetraspora malaysiensis TaxID=161358 RepID=UPI003D8AEFFA